MLNLLDVNPTKSVVVANNLVGAKKGLGGHFRRITKDTKEVVVRSTKRPIGKGMEVTMIGRSNVNDKRDPGGGWC